MHTSKKIFIALVFIMSALFSCTKKGDTGAAGATGTANVMYTSWSPLSMTYNSTDSAYEQTITADSITQAVLDSGLVLSYIKYTNSSSQVQVENAGNYMEEVYGLQSINLYSYGYDYTGVSFRYVIIHGGSNITGRLADTSTLIRGYTKKEWQAMPYDKVMALLGSQ